jgi:Xaa-Pro aminopeptidase
LGHDRGRRQANGSLPHYSPGDARDGSEEQASLLIDWGAALNGYRGDMTRVFAFGRWPRRRSSEIYSIVLDAHEKAAAAIEPGVTNRELDSIARGDHKAGLAATSSATAWATGWVWRRTKPRG